MRRKVEIGLALSLAFASHVAKAAEPSQDTQAMLQAADAAFKTRDCKAGSDLAVKLTVAPGFADLPERSRQFVYYLGLACAMESAQPALAVSYSEKAIKFTDPPVFVWFAHVVALTQLNRNADAVTGVEAMASASPQALNSMRSRFWRMLTQRVQAAPDLQGRLYKVLASPAHAPEQPGSNTDWYKMGYASVLAKKGDKAAVAKLVATIEDPTVLVAMSVDPELRFAIAPDFDAKAITERYIVRMREVAAAHGGALLPQMNVAEKYRMLGKYAEALATMEALDPETAGQDISDRAEMLNWWWDAKAEAHAALGNYDRALDAFSRGRSIREDGGTNVNQTINMAGFQLSYGRNREALQTLGLITAGARTNPYGLAQVRSIGGCARFRLGKRAEAAADLTYLRSHAKDAPGALTRLLRCMGDVEGAAASFVDRLNNPDQRADALLQLSEFEDSPTPEPPAMVTARASNVGLAAIRRRPGVAAAIARAGGTRKFNIVEAR